MKKRQEKERQKELQKRRLEDTIRMHHDLTPSINSKNYQEKIINNFRTNSYLPSATTTFGWSQAYLSRNSLPYARENLTNHTGSDFTGFDSAIPDFESFLRNNFDGNKRERKKSKLMQVCVDHTRSTLNKLQHQKTIELMNDDVSTSTGINNDDDS